MHRTLLRAAAIVMLGPVGIVGIVGIVGTGARARPRFETPQFVLPPVSLPQAEAIADKIGTAWTSMDAARIKALYASGIVGVDVAPPGISTTKAKWDALQGAYVAMKIDGSLRKARTIQLIDGDAFLVSGWWHITSSTIPAYGTDIRCTDLLRRIAGRWLIVNEHCSVPLKG